MCEYYMFSLTTSQIHSQLLPLNTLHSQLLPLNTLQNPKMDTISAKKLQIFDDSHKNQSLYSLTLNLILVALTLSLLWYFLCWFLLPLPNSLSTSLLTPKCLFIVVNVIVMFLVGESRFSSSNSSISPSTQIYDEYVERSRDLRSFSSLQQEVKLVANTLTSEDKEEIELRQEEVKEVEEVVVQEKSDEKDVEMEEIKEVVEMGNDDNIVDEEEKEKYCVEEESECGMATEELNRRVEEFIARVNKQRWLEARFLVCCEA